MTRSPQVVPSTPLEHRGQPPLRLLPLVLPLVVLPLVRTTCEMKIGPQRGKLEQKAATVTLDWTWIQQQRGCNAGTEGDTFSWRLAPCCPVVTLVRVHRV